MQDISGIKDKSPLIPLFLRGRLHAPLLEKERPGEIWLFSLLEKEGTHKK